MFNQLKMMRMKKLWIFGLIAFVFTLALSMQSRVAPVDNDVGYAYVLSTDQIQSDMNIVTPSVQSPLYISGYTIPVCPDVGSSLGLVNPLNENVPEILWQINQSTIGRTNATQKKAIKVEGLLRLDIGEQYSQGRAMSRHT